MRVRTITNPSIKVTPRLRSTAFDGVLDPENIVAAHLPKLPVPVLPGIATLHEGACNVSPV